MGCCERACCRDDSRKTLERYREKETSCQTHGHASGYRVWTDRATNLNWSLEEERGRERVK